MTPDVRNQKKTIMRLRFQQACEVHEAGDYELAALRSARSTRWCLPTWASIPTSTDPASISPSAGPNSSSRMTLATSTRGL
jgi:hypothetical protein|tara:strand:- start:1485 stop:1727 length:243 start_codon:yes stop_codon:yes gene_type:complete